MRVVFAGVLVAALAAQLAVVGATALARFRPPWLVFALLYVAAGIFLIRAGWLAGRHLRGSPYLAAIIPLTLSVGAVFGGLRAYPLFLAGIPRPATSGIVDLWVQEAFLVLLAAFVARKVARK